VSDEQNVTQDENLRRKLERQEPRKVQWLPSLSLKFGLMHLWAGSQLSDGRRIFLLLEEIQNWTFEFKIHWLTAETPMFGLYAWPYPVAYFFWLHSYDVLGKLGK
jgi:hypothetical protein